MIAAALSARHVLARDPLLRWEAIAAHARDHHGHTWPSDDAAISAITGAFDAVTPSGVGYYPAEGTLKSPELASPPSWSPQWNDPELFNCVIATLAAGAADCDLERIYGWLPPEDSQEKRQGGQGTRLAG